MCGGEFGTASLQRHIKSCIKKWEQQQEQLSAKERRPLPTKPALFDEVLKPGNLEVLIEKYNEQAMNSYNEFALLKCPGCKRTFFPEQLAKHQHGC